MERIGFLREVVVERIGRLAYRCCYMRDPRTVRLLYELPEVASLALKLSSRMDGRYCGFHYLI